MQSQGNSHDTGKTVESKEGERRLLSCNMASRRSPSLEFNPNTPFVSEDMQLEYLAEIYVGIFLEQKRHERTQKQASSDLLPGIHKGTGGRG